MTVHVDLPVAKTVQVWPLADGSLLQAQFHLPAGDVPLCHPCPVMFQDHDPAAVGSKLVDHPQSCLGSHPGRDDLSYEPIKAICPYQNDIYVIVNVLKWFPTIELPMIFIHATSHCGKGASWTADDAFG
jgi:hypothetical protein